MTDFPKKFLNKKDEPNLEARYYVKAESVLAGPHPAVIKLLAIQQMRDQYINVGDWFRDLTLVDLEYIEMIFNASNEEVAEGEITDELGRSSRYFLVTLVLMLSAGEGIYLSNNDLPLALASFGHFLVAESLSRHGRVTLNRKNMTFDPCMSLGELATPVSSMDPGAD